jgi:hypothetical protein
MRSPHPLLLQARRIARAPDRRNRTAGAVAGEAVVRIGIHGTAQSSGIEREVGVRGIGRSAGPLEPYRIEGDRGCVDIHSSTGNGDSRHTIARDHRVDDVNGTAADDRDTGAAAEDSHIAERRLDQAAPPAAPTVMPDVPTFLTVVFATASVPLVRWSKIPIAVPPKLPLIRQSSIKAKLPDEVPETLMPTTRCQSPGS